MSGCSRQAVAIATEAFSQREQAPAQPGKPQPDHHPTGSTQQAGLCTAVQHCLRAHHR